MMNRIGLLDRARTLEGHSIGYLADWLAYPLPETLKQQKGLIGQLVEAYLGAEAGCRPEPDFKDLGVELKTVPVDSLGKPKASTYVCAVPLTPDNQPKERTWETCSVYRKLETVLWVPFEANPKQALADWRFQRPWMMSLSTEMTRVLKQDWAELMECLVLGEATTLNASLGTYLHIRPKAANRRIRRSYLTAEGEVAWLGPKGFYLRPSFIPACLADKANKLTGA